MADVRTTLHPEGAPEDNLYPNIKRENIPDPALFGDLLWENASYTSPFSAQTINVGDLSGYRILRIVALITGSQNQARQIFDMELRSWGVQKIYLGMFDDTSDSTYHRGINVNPNGTLDIESGYRDGTQYNDACVPMFVYGIK